MIVPGSEWSELAQYVGVQEIAWQEPVYSGVTEEAVMVPTYPLLQVHPLGTDVPVECAGQETAEHVTVVKVPFVWHVARKTLHSDLRC